MIHTSIIITVHDEKPGWIKRAIKSAEMQTAKNIEIVIVADKATEEVTGLVRVLAAERGVLPLPLFATDTSSSRLSTETWEAHATLESKLPRENISPR